VAKIIKVLGQQAPGAASLTTLYTVPALTSTVCSSITVCNRSSVATSFRVAIRPAGAAISNEMYLYYDVAIAGNDTFIATIGITLATTDVVSVYNTLATLSFTLYGQEAT
jgi:glucose-6-phosphate dehydrogenase assembly protein OpcA